MNEYEQKITDIASQADGADDDTWFGDLGVQLKAVLRVVPRGTTLSLGTVGVGWGRVRTLIGAIRHDLVLVERKV